MDRNRHKQKFNLHVIKSLSARRAWIEIMALDQYLNEQEASLSARRAWIEITPAVRSQFMWMSLSARRAWIEIRQHPAGEKQRTVALRKESVDRNTF